MRLPISSSLSVLLYSIIVLLYKFLECQDICKERELLNYHEIVVENDSYHYSLHYQYSLRIRLDQPHPIANSKFVQTDRFGSVGPKFSPKFYDNDVITIENFKKKNQFGSRMMANEPLGEVKYSIDARIHKVELLNGEELLAIRWFIKSKKHIAPVVDGSVINLMYPNGKISMYYENIPTQFEQHNSGGEMFREFQCKMPVSHQLLIPQKWAKTGALVEFEVIGTHCPKYKTPETCQNAATMNTKCFWCGRAKTCIESNDKATHDLKVNDCRVEKISEVDELSKPTPTIPNESTLMSTEVQVTEKVNETAEGTGQDSKISEVDELSKPTPTIPNESTLMSTEVQVTEKVNETAEGTGQDSKISEVDELSKPTPTIPNESTLMSTEVQVTEKVNETAEGTGQDSKISEVDELSKPTPTIPNESTLMSTEVQVTEKVNETTEGTGQDSNVTVEISKVESHSKSSVYLYIVIPLFVSLLVICICGIIWRWVYKKRRSNE
ncbi:unnamed protein product [Schistosoma haematobium]|nr:unnamed protein product [Schistosoma haematobium]